MIIPKQLKIDSLKHTIKEVKDGDFWICCIITDYISNKLKFTVNTNDIPRSFPEMIELKNEWNTNDRLRGEKSNIDLGWWDQDDSESRIEFCEELIEKLQS